MDSTTSQHDFDELCATPPSSPTPTATTITPTLRILTLNTRGLIDSDKRTLVFQLLKDKAIDVACLQETHAGAAEASWWTKQWPGPSVWTTAASSDDRSSGTALLFADRFSNADIKLIRKDDVQGRYIHATLRANADLTLNLVGLYAPNSAPQRRTFFQDLQDICTIDDDANLHLQNAILGDFNCVANAELDRVAGAPASPNDINGIVQLTGLTAALNTIDVWRTLHPNMRSTTWRTAHTGSRLDRIYIDKALCNDASCTVTPLLLSDHDAVICTINMSKIERGPGYWMLNTALLSHPELRIEIQAAVTDAITLHHGHPNELWEQLKFSIRHLCMQYGQRVAKEKKKELEEATAGYLNAVDAWTDHATDQHAATMMSARLHLEQLQSTQFAAAQVRSRQRWHIKGEKATRYFCQLEKERARDKQIAELQHPATGATCCSPTDKGDAAAFYYADLFSPDAPDNEDAMTALINRLPASTRLDDNQRALCDAEITLEELKQALDTSPGGKTPGLDGLPKELYVAFWDLLAAPLLSMIQYSIVSGSLPRSCREGIISLVHKKGARTHLDNYRPLTMLTVDYKILSKVMANRIDRVIDHLVHPDQTGFISRRFILENVITTRSIRRHCAATNTKAAIVFLDQQKAFDRVSWAFRDRVLLRMGFGPAFCGLVKLLHHDVHAQININGFLSPRFSILRGTRQGDPLSPFLFALVDEPFACSVRADPLYRGLPMPEGYDRSAKISQYADDKAMFISSNDDAFRLNHHLRLYEDAAGARVNMNKSAALLLGPAIEADFDALQVPVLQAGQTTKYLGFKIGPTFTDRDLWIECAAKLTATLAQWTRRNLTISGRITVIRLLATSKLWYIAYMVSPPEDILAQMDRAVRRFLWKGAMSGPVKSSVCLAPRSSGGLGMIDIASTISGLQLSWLRRLLDSSDGKWKDLALNELRSSALAMRWGLDARVLLASTTRADLPSPWAGILRSVNKVHLHEKEPTTLERVLQQHLFLNSWVTNDAGVPLRTKAMKNTARNGISHFRDLLDEDNNIRSRQDLGLSKVTFERIINAVPRDWLLLLHDGPSAPLPGEWFMFDTIMPPSEVLRIHAIVDGMVTLHCFNSDRDSTFASDHSSERHVSLMDFTFIRAHVTPHRNGFLCHGPLQLLELDPDRLLIDQLINGRLMQKTITESTVNGTTKALTALKAEVPDLAQSWPNIVLPWKRAFHWVWSSLRDRHINDFLFKLIHRRLPLGERRLWDPDLNISCPCGLQLETLPHLLCECDVAKSVWKWFFAAWRKATGHALAGTPQVILFGSIPPSKIRVNDKAYWNWFRIAQPEVLYTIWLARNRWVFDEEPFSAVSIKVHVSVRILRAGQAAVLQHTDGFFGIGDALLAALQDTILQ